ncbi:MAG: hypothetical protein KY439_01240 [Actinobacteria bacterium]|nr:hypothetical protein [Actinomycetota bacterium]
MTTRDTTVWALAEATGQPLEVVIFQAVAYEAWNPGGAIGADWASALTGVLNGSHPWRRQTHHHATESLEAGDEAPAVIEVETGGEGGRPQAAFAAAVLGALGSAVTVEDTALCEQLSGCGLGEMTVNGFVGFPEEAPTWAQLAAGTITVEELDER